MAVRKTLAMQKLIREYEKTYLKNEDQVPDLQPGDTVRVNINIYEGSTDHIAGLKKIHRIAAKGKAAKGGAKVERVQVFEGTVISIKGAGWKKPISSTAARLRGSRLCAARTCAGPSYITCATGSARRSASRKDAKRVKTRNLRKVKQPSNSRAP